MATISPAALVAVLYLMTLIEVAVEGSLMAEMAVMAQMAILAIMAVL